MKFLVFWILSNFIDGDRFVTIIDSTYRFYQPYSVEGNLWNSYCLNNGKSNNPYLELL